MKDLYRSLGLSGIEDDPRVIERALEREGHPGDITRQARFVLLDPVRKARYDRILKKATAISQARLRLGLSVDPLLPPPPCDPGAWGGRAPIPGSADSERPWALWIGVSGAILFAALIWARFPGNEKATAPRLPVPAIEQGPPPSEVWSPDRLSTRGSAEEPISIPSPEHGWCQIAFEARPSIPWHIETDSGQDYLLTLLDAQTHETVLTLFLKGGQPYESMVPEGAFELRLTSGTRWFGLRQGFGVGASVIQSPQVFRIKAQTDGASIWNLVIHPSGCEVPPVAPVEPTNRFRSQVDRNPVTGGSMAL